MVHSGTSLVVYVGTKSQLKKQTALGGMAVRLIRGLVRGNWTSCLEKAVVVSGQHMTVGFENAAPLAVSASFWSSNPAGASPQPMQVTSGHSRNMQEQVFRCKRSPVHLLSTQMTGKKKSLGL